MAFFNKYAITTKIIILNVVLFFVFMSLIYLGVPLEKIAVKPLDILSGKNIWTLLTSMFMHGGILHLFVNMFSLFFMGNLTERILGAKRYLFFYLGAGIFSSLIYVFSSLIPLFSETLKTPAVGASGALFGIVGVLMILTPNLPVHVMLIPIPIKLKYAAPGLLVLLWLVSIGGNIPIGNIAHLAGLTIGLGYGFYVKKKFPQKTKRIKRMFS